MEKFLFDFGAIRLEWHHVLLSMLLAFVCSSTIAVCYEKTFRGLSWSRNLLHTMILGSMVACLLMIAIGDNVARGIGIVGSLAIVRFRTNLRDSRDLVFLFGAMGVGVANGVRSYGTALIGTVLFCAVAFGLNATGLGARRSPDGLVRFQAPAGPEVSGQLARILSDLPAHFALITMRPLAQGGMVEYAYQVRLKTEGAEEQLLRRLEQIAGVRGLTYVSQQTTVEM